MSLANKLCRMMANLERLLPIFCSSLWSRGLKYHVLKENNYLHSCNAYDFKTWKNGDLT